MSFHTLLATLPPKFQTLLQTCMEEYREASELPPAVVEERFNKYLGFIIQFMKEPYPFEPYHEKLLFPVNFETFGVEFIRPLIQFEESQLVGKEHIKEIANHIRRKENVILLANHQIEPDPQILHLLLENEFSELAQAMIFVAGDRVVTDPMAVPFSLGCNLFCIYSKKHIENPPHLKQEKLLHNQRTLKRMADVLREGGKCIYVAPSGGRDRKGDDGVLTVAPFDGQSIEMLYLIAKQAETPTHFYPLALATYDILPPPTSVGGELGEKRTPKKGAVKVSFGSQIDMEDYPGCDHPDRKERRANRAKTIWQQVVNMYEKIQN